MSDSGQLGLGQRIAFGLLFVAAGLVPMLAAFDIGPLRSADINGPAWLGLVSGGVFALAGLTVMAGRLPPLVSSLLVLALLAGLAVLGNWIAFGAGERLCSGSISLPFLWIERDLSGLGCRIPFGIGALAINGIFFYAAVKTLQQALGGPPRLVRLVKVGEWLLMAGLLPILLPLVLFLLLHSGGSAVLKRIRTGQWPRNEEFIARRLKRKKGAAA
jgi:hypothetical protein